MTTTSRPRGLVLRGRVWPGGGEPQSYADGAVLVAADGTVAALGPADALDLPVDLPTLGGLGAWIGPGLVDAHVHLAFGAANEALAGGVVAVRDLGAPLAEALRWRTPEDRPGGGEPLIAVAGPLLTAPGGYPSTTWGAAGFARPLAAPEQARAVVRELAQAGVDLIKLALEPADGQPTPDPDTVRAAVAAAHERGLAVTAHALTAAMVVRALDAGVDELAHVPTEPLPAALVQRLATAGIPVVSTLHTHARWPEALANARALVAAGVPLAYGTDLGNEGTRTGVEPRELRLLADAGLGPAGALRAATAVAAHSAGLRGRCPAGLEVGAPVAAVVLPGDPMRDPECWRRPIAVVRRQDLLVGDLPGRPR